MEGGARDGRCHRRRAVPRRAAGRRPAASSRRRHGRGGGLQRKVSGTGGGGLYAPVPLYVSLPSAPPARGRHVCQLPAAAASPPGCCPSGRGAVRCGAGSLPPWAACCGSLAARGPRARLGVAEPCAGRLPFPSSGAGQLAQLYALTPFFLCPNIHSKQRSCRTSACPVFDIPLVLCVTSDSHLSVLLRYSCSSLCCLM